MSAVNPPCPACGNPANSCQGHGYIGDPVGWATVNAHLAGDHSTCHEACACAEPALVAEQATIEEQEFLNHQDQETRALWSLSIELWEVGRQTVTIAQVYRRAPTDVIIPPWEKLSLRQKVIFHNTCRSEAVGTVGAWVIIASRML